jgi:hypothetical protein
MAKIIFKTTTNWTCPVGVDKVLVECWAGGGAGGNATGNPSAGGGGAGGCYARKLVTVTPGTTYNVVVGVGGNPTGLRDGQDSYFLDTSTVVARGGRAGGNASSNNENGLAGDNTGLSNIGDVTYLGGNGTDGVFTSGVYTGNAGGGAAGSTGAGGNASSGTGGTGTADYGGNGANGPTSNNTAGNAAAATATGVGGGGSGGKANNATDRNGGAGARGQVILTFNGGDFFQLL